MTVSKWIAVAGGFTVQGTLGAFADTTAMCLDMAGMTDARCECATKALAAEVSPEALGQYDAVSARYVEKLASGQAMVEAWDAAIAETASETGTERRALLESMNDVGKAHRTAILGCD